MKLKNHQTKSDDKIKECKLNSCATVMIVDNFFLHMTKELIRIEKMSKKYTKDKLGKLMRIIKMPEKCDKKKSISLACLLLECVFPHICALTRILCFGGIRDEMNEATKERGTKNDEKL